MSEATFTPGPWNNLFCAVWSPSGIVANTTSAKANEENQANARLIAATPDLLEALQAICTKIAHNDDGEYIREFEAAQVAICKALGNTQPRMESARSQNEGAIIEGMQAAENEPTYPVPAWTTEPPEPDFEPDDYKTEQAWAERPTPYDP